MEIRWSEKADKSFDKILESIGNRFTTKEVDRFVIQTYEVLAGIKEFPNIYPESLKLPNVRKAVIHPHSTVYYRVGNENIVLLFFWDNRNDPAKIK